MATVSMSSVVAIVSMSSVVAIVSMSSLVATVVILFAIEYLCSLFSASSVFVEQRRRALKRFLTLIVRHPILSKDEVVKFFLTAGGHEVGTRVKDKFKNSPDEYSSNPDAEKAEVSHMTFVSITMYLPRTHTLVELKSVT